MRETFLARTVAIQLVAAQWAADVATSNVTRNAMIDAIFVSNKTANDTGYENAFDSQRSVLKEGQAIFDRRSDTLLVITVKQLATYALPVLSSEVITAGALPAVAVVGTLDIALKSGASSLSISARTATYGSTSQYDFYKFADMNDQHIRDANAFSVTITLFADTWKSDIAVSSSLRETLVTNVLASNRATIDAGYDFGFRAMLALDTYTVIRNSDTQVVVVIPQLSAYNIPAGGTEMISAGVIPQTLVNGVNQISLKTGVFSNTITARTASFTGSFFHPSVFKTIEDIAATSTFTIEISLAGDKWHASVASDTKKRQALIDAVLDSDHPSNEVGYSQGWEAQRMSWASANVNRVNDTYLTITVPQFSSYYLSPGLFELVGFTSIPGSCVTSSSVAIQLSLGHTSISLRSRSAAYSGTFFRSEDRIDGDLTNAVEYPIIITLANEIWHPSIATDATLRQLLVDAIMVSDRQPSETGYDLALVGQNQQFSAAYVQRQSDTQVTVTVPQYPTYYLPPYQNETITTTHIPSACVVGTAQFTVDVTSSSGLQSVTIKARTARFDGIFYSCETSNCSESNAKTDENIRAGGASDVGSLYWIKITLIGNTWLSDVSTSTSRRMSLLRKIFTSDRDYASDAGYANSMAYYLTNDKHTLWPEKFDDSVISPGVYRQSDEVVQIVIPSLATYALPGGGSETLTAAGIPRECQDGSEDIVTMAGTRSLKILPRTATYLSTGNTFFSTDYKTDENMRTLYSNPYRIQIELSHATWDLDVNAATFPNNVFDSSKRDTLVRAVLRSSQAQTNSGYSQAFDRQLDFYASSVGANYVYQETSTLATIYLPQMVSTTTAEPTYQLPALGSETITIGDIPASVISSGTDMPAISVLGQTSVELRARTASYTGDFFSSTVKNDDNIRSLPIYTIVVQLTATHWIANISGDATHRQNLIDAVLGSDRAITDAGYEYAMAYQRQNYAEANVVQNSNQTITISVPAFPDYLLYPDGFETITPLDIPLSLVQDSAVVYLKEGTRSITIQARTAQFSGSFFDASGKTDSDLIGGDPTDSGLQWHIYVDLTYEAWQVDIVTDATKRQGLVNIVMASNRSSTESGYETALQHQIQNWPISQMVRMSNTRVKISLNPLPGYIVSPFGTELIAATTIPAEFIIGASSLKTRSGQSSLVIQGRTAEYGGTFFSTTPKTDENIKDSQTYTVTVKLYYDTWASDVVTDAAKRQALVEAVLASDHIASDFGYELAMSTQILNFPQANVVLDAANNMVTITVPQFTAYALYALGSETITAQPIPASVISSLQPLTLQSGVRSVLIQGRSVTYSGTFFSASRKLDDDLRNPSAAFTVVATLTAEKWNPNVATDATLRQVLVEAVLKSNQPKTQPGFENGFAKMVENFPAENVYFNATESEHVVKITIPSFPNYIEGRDPDYFDANEIIEASNLPHTILQGNLAILANRMMAGTQSTCCWNVDIQPRNLRFTGTFFVLEGKTTEDLQDQSEWDIIIDVFRDSWHPNIATDPALRTLLVQSVLASNHNYTEAGYEYAMAYQVPQFTTYELPPTKSETVSLSSIHPSLINGVTAISLSQPCCSLAGYTSVYIMSRTALFSGTFFGTTKKQFEVRNVGGYTIVIDFAHNPPYFGAQWSTDVISNRDTRQALINAIVDSDKSNTTVGGKTETVPNYENAIAKQLENFHNSFMERVNATRLIITIPAFPGYQLPKYDNSENIQAGLIPASAVSGQIPISQKLGIQTAILEGVFLLLNTSVSIPSAGVLGSVTLSFTSPHSVDSSGVIVITAPSGYPYSDTTGYKLGQYNGPGLFDEVELGTVTGLSGSLSISRSDQVMTITGFTEIPLLSPVTIQLTNIRSHAAAQSESWHVQLKDSAANVIDEDITSLISTPAMNILTGVQITCDDSLGAAVCKTASQGVPNAGVKSKIAFTFVNVGNVPESGKVRVTFPSGFVLSDVAVESLVGITPTWNGTHGTNITATVVGLNVEIRGFTEILTGSKSFVLTGVQSPASNLTDSFIIGTTDNFNNYFDEITTGLQFTPPSGNITNVSLSCDIAAGHKVCGYDNVFDPTTNVTTKVYRAVPNAGVLGSIIVTMTITGAIDAAGQIKMVFPDGFVLESPQLVGSTLPGLAISLTTTGQLITISNFNASIPPSEVSFTVSNVRSHASKLSGMFAIDTTDSNGNLYDSIIGPQYTPSRGNVTNVTITIPSSGVIGTVHVSFNIEGQVPADGQINVTVPHDYALGMYNQASGKLEFFAAVVNPSGVLSGSVYIKTIDEASNSAIIGGFNRIEPGHLAFDLDYVKPGAGAAGTFMIQTQDADGFTIDDTRFGDEAGQATSSAGIAPVTGSLGDLKLTAPTAGSKSEFKVEMVTNGEVESTGQIMIYFPIGFEVWDATISQQTGRLWLSHAMTSTAVNGTNGNCNLTTVCGGGVVSVAGFERIAPGQLSFTMQGVRSPAVGTYSFKVETGDVSGFVIDQKTTTVTVTPSIMSDVFIEVQNAGIEGDMIMEFTNLGYTPQDGQLKLTLPSQTKFGLPSPFLLGDVSLLSYGGMLSSAPSLSKSGTTITLSNIAYLGPGKVTMVFSNVRSPGSAETSPFLLQTVDANGLVLNQNPELLTLTPPTGKLSTVSLLFPSPGKRGTMNVSFATEATLVDHGKVKIVFPESFDLPHIDIKAHSPGGVLGADTIMDVETNRMTKTVTVNVNGPIPEGSLSFQLYPMEIPVGFSAGTFHISTTDDGSPDRVFDQIEYALVNTADVQYWWDEDLDTKKVSEVLVGPGYAPVAGVSFPTNL